MLNLSDLAYLQMPWPKSTVGASCAKEGLVGLLQQLKPHQQAVLPPTTAASTEEKKVKAKKEESEESDADKDFGLFH